MNSQENLREHVLVLSDLFINSLFSDNPMTAICAVYDTASVAELAALQDGVTNGSASHFRWLR